MYETNLENVLENVYFMADWSDLNRVHRSNGGGYGGAQNQETRRLEEIREQELEEQKNSKLYNIKSGAAKKVVKTLSWAYYIKNS